MHRLEVKKKIDITNSNLFFAYRNKIFDIQNLTLDPGRNAKVFHINKFIFCIEARLY